MASDTVYTLKKTASTYGGKMKKWLYTLFQAYNHFGAGERIRTPDLLITNNGLYLLKYIHTLSHI